MDRHAFIYYPCIFIRARQHKLQLHDKQHDLSILSNLMESIAGPVPIDFGHLMSINKASKEVRSYLFSLMPTVLIE